MKNKPFTNRIKKLASQGKSKTEIMEILGCNHSTVRYHLDPVFRQERDKARRKKRRDDSTKLKLYFGGKCIRCGYDKCLDALHFHHTDPNNKECDVNIALHYGYNMGLQEAQKCELICANCHAEIHSKLTIFY